MRLFAVRAVKNQEPVGFFWVDDLAGLLQMVDETTEPDLCEYKPIAGPGAIIWPGKVDDWKMGMETLPNDFDGGDAEMQHQSVIAESHFEGALFDFVNGIMAIPHWKHLGEVASEQNFSTKYPRGTAR
jgi:hypothetical protein